MSDQANSDSRNEPSRQRTFQQFPLTLPGRKLPPSIPLILPSNLEYDPVTNSIKKIMDGVESSGPPQLCLNDDALELLQNINKPVAVLAICGPFRSGKSYFLSQMLGSNDAFKVGHGMHACTRGIWMATTALECEEFVLLLLDTEGIDATGVNISDATTARNILVLSTLASSYLIYNSKGQPEQSDLDKMSCFAQLSSYVLTHDDSDDLPDHNKYFPDLLWLLRDVQFKITNEEGEPLTPTKYIKSLVLVRSKDPGMLSPNDEVVKALRTLFPSLECQIIPHPMTKNPAKDPSKISRKFNKALEEVIQFIHGNIKVKKGYGESDIVDGPTLATLLGQYVRAVNSAPQLSLESIWLRVIQPRFEHLAQKALTVYENKMTDFDPFLPLEEGEPENEGDIATGGPPGSESDVATGGPPESKGDIATGGPPESEGDVATGGPPESEDDVATGGPPESKGDVATGGPPESEVDVATGGPPESKGDVATGGPPENEGDVATCGPPESKGDVATGGPPENEGDVATCGPPENKCDVATAGPPESEGDVVACGPPESEGDVATGGPPESEDDIATGESPESEGDVATCGPPESEGDVVRGGPPESEGDVVTGGLPKNEDDVAESGTKQVKRKIMVEGASTCSNDQAPQTLMEIHRKILGATITNLQQEMDRITPVSSVSTEVVKNKIFTDLKKQIAEYEYDQEGTLKVKGGVLYQFIEKNYQKSTEHCEEVFTRVYSPLMENFNQPFDDKVDEYMTRAIGPAKQAVFEKRKRELFGFSTRLAPGSPQNLKAVGRGSKCIKICWEPPTLHLLLTHHYSVEIRKTKDSGSMWSEVKKTKRMSALVTNLNSDTKYSFRVRGVTALKLVGNPSEEVHTETKFSAAARTTAAVVAGLGAGVVAPFAIPFYPVIAPAVGVVAYNVFKEEGDLEPSDDEEVDTDYEEIN